MPDPWQGLNRAQREAVTSSASVLQVLAPPGSGKTKTLTARVAHLITVEKLQPCDIICCTFTIKASREMRERLRAIIGADLESQLILGTFHSVCRRYLARYGHLIGIPSGFGIADSSDSLAIVKRIVKKLRSGTDAKAFRSRISHRKARGLRDARTHKKASRQLAEQEFSQVLDEYEKELAAASLLDYDDLLLRCGDLLRQRPECVSNVQAVLIDEYQDTNLVQLDLMTLFAAHRRRVTIVGDPDQSIYGFRAAEKSNLAAMRKIYADTVVINLEENYRSSAAILRAAQAVIDQDVSRHPKQLKATHGYGSRPVLRKLATAHDEARWVVSEVIRLQNLTGQLLDLSDFAILLRSAHLSRLIESALGKAGIPYRMVGGSRFFDREEIKILLNYLRVISQPRNNSALVAVINVPSRKLGEETMKEVFACAERKQLCLWDVILQTTKGEGALIHKISKPAIRGLKDVRQVIESSRKVLLATQPDRGPRDLLLHIIEKLSYEKHLRVKHPEDHENRWANVQELLTTASDLAENKTLSTDATFDETLPGIDGIEQQQLTPVEETLAQFLASITLSANLQAVDDRSEQKCLTISTIHAAKGLEWPIVFIPAVFEGSIPHSRAEDTDEELRLLYVAMTRAQSQLYLSVPLKQSIDYSPSEVSHFLPDDLRRYFCTTGPNIDDAYIAHTASTLRRPEPSQEAVVEGLKNLTAEQSISDDLWLEDGSEPAKKYWQHEEAHIPGSVRSLLAPNIVQHGLDNVGTARPLNEQTSFSTAFTTAKAYKDLVLQDESHVKPELCKSSTKVADTVLRPCRKMATDSSQGKLTTFFTSPPVKLAGDLAYAKLGNRLNAKDGVDEPGLPAVRIPKATVAIPRDLSAHRPSNDSRPLKKIRTTFDESSSTNEQRYPFMSSSPTKDIQESVQDDVQISSTRPTTCATKNGRGQDTGRCEFSRAVTNSYQSATTFHNTKMNAVNSTGPHRKTLGVRRSMNGWDSRKNR